MRQGSLFAFLVIAVLPCSSLMAEATALTSSPPPQVRTADKASERLDVLEKKEKEFEDKIDRATLKNEYTQQIQKQYETYYEKAFSTQLQILGILGIILSVLLFLAGRFGLGIFDRQIQLELKSATDSMRLEFENRLGTQVQSLSDKNSAQLKELEEGVKKKIEMLGSDLQLRSDFQFELSTGMGAHVANSYEAALTRLRAAIIHYRTGKDRGAVPFRDGEMAIRLLFFTMMGQEESTFNERAKEELKDDIYKGLGEELRKVAERIPNLLPLLEANY